MKTIKTNVTLGVVDPDLSTPEVRDRNGNVTREAKTAIKHIPAGEPVTLEDAEADRIIARHGHYEERPAFAGHKIIQRSVGG